VTGQVTGDATGESAFVDRYGPWAVVLGASEGLGEAYAHGLAERGLSVVVAARRAEPLQRVADQVAKRHRVQTVAVPLDLGQPAFVETLSAVTDALDCGLVVYNGAGAYVGPFLDQGVASMRSVVSINCLGPALVCGHFGPRLAARRRGGIVLMGSAAGLAGSAYNATYAASKAFDIVLGESLWAEWRELGVDVLSVIGPAIDTPNFRALSPGQSEGMPEPIAPEAVVEEVLAALGSTPSFVPGDVVRELLTALGGLPRRQQVEALSAAQASLAKGRPPSVPRAR
jgi:short-subunit dehydrogenase